MRRFEKGDIVHRVESLVFEIISYCRTKNKEIDRSILDQILRAVSSVGANLAEANATLSDREFVRILAIVIRELYESMFRCRLITQCFNIDMMTFHIRLEEITKIIHTIITKTKSRLS